MWCSGNQIEFQANLEQWDLLSRRPVISPVRPFTADPELLSGAALPSVGSFGVFHRGCCCRESGFFYVSADCLQPKGAPKTRSGKLVVNHGHPPMRHLQGFAERTYCEDVGSFGQALYELEI